MGHDSSSSGVEIQGQGQGLELGFGLRSLIGGRDSRAYAFIVRSSAAI